MKKVLPLCITLFALPLFAQTTLNCSGKERDTKTVGNYDYELWSQNGAGSASMTVPGSIGANGGTFTSTWSKTINVLSRAGKKFTNNETVSSVGNITVEFAATWSSGDDVRMLGVYGWGYFASGQQPNNFSDQIEYYIIQDRGPYNSATQGTNCSQKGSATIDGIEYNFTTCDRLGQPMLTGNGNFKQYFSYPKNTSGHRTSGTITVSKHFEEWAKAGMTMNRLYEVAMKVESYTGNNGNANGNANVTKNILTIGGTLPSSNSGGGTTPASSSSRASSSSGAAATQANNCNNFIGSLPANPNPPANPYTACFKHSNNKCYVCKVENESDGNTCSSTWVWSNGTNNGVNIVDDNIDKGYWYSEVTCPASSSSRASSSSAAVSSSSRAASSSSRASSSSAAVASSSSRASSSSVAVASSSSRASSSSVAGSGNSSSSEGNATKILSVVPSTKFKVSSLSGRILLIDSQTNTTVYLYDTKGNMAEKINVNAGSSITQLSVLPGIYVVKNAKTGQPKMVVVK